MKITIDEKEANLIQEMIIGICLKIGKAVEDNKAMYDLYKKCRNILNRYNTIKKIQIYKKYTNY
jgi:hypothetical protein